MRVRWNLGFTKINKIILIVLIVASVLALVLLAKPDTVTGRTTDLVLTVCFNGQPDVNPIADQTTAVGTTFTLQVVASDPENQTLTYVDNSPLFTINPATGLIQFVPSAPSISNVTITVSDPSPCSNNQTQENFTLTITGVAPIQPTPPRSGGGGGSATRRSTEMIGEDEILPPQMPPVIQAPMKPELPVLTPILAKQPKISKKPAILVPPTETPKALRNLLAVALLLLVALALILPHSQKTRRR